MVCNTTQSAFYKVISDYNEDISRNEKYCSENSGKKHENMREKTHKKILEKSRNKTEQRCDGNTCENRSENYSDRSKISAKNCQKNDNKNRGNSSENFGCKNRQNDLFADSDFLLICALIYILYKNNADQKLILALIFVLIG